MRAFPTLTPGHDPHCPTRWERPRISPQTLTETSLGARPCCCVASNGHSSGLWDAFKDLTTETVDGPGHGCCWMSPAPREVPVSLRPVGVLERGGDRRVDLDSSTASGSVKKTELRGVTLERPCFCCDINTFNY